MINLLFAGNYKVYDALFLTLMSITKHSNRALNVHVLTADVTELNPDYRPLDENHRKSLEEYIQKANKDSKVTLIHLGKDFNEWMLDSKNKLNSYTPFAFLRLFADKVDLPDKILYLDTDIMFNGDISELYDINVEEYELGVVLDRYGRFFISPRYFNSGMLLMNMKNVKESNLLEKVRIRCATKKMKFPDQSALNKHCKRKLYLPRRFNEQGNPRKDTIVQHFSKRIIWFPFHTINIKQNHIDKVQNVYKIHNYDDIYEEFLTIKSNSDIDKPITLW